MEVNFITQPFNTHTIPHLIQNWGGGGGPIRGWKFCRRKNSLDPSGDRNTIFRLGDSSLSTKHTELPHPNPLFTGPYKIRVHRGQIVISMFRRNPGIYELYSAFRPTQQFADCSNGFCVMQRTGGQVLYPSSLF
jgi:hypothetical protein